MTKIISAKHLAREAIEDLWKGFMRYEAWSLLALHDLRQKFRRSMLGPFWITVSMAILIGTLSLITTTLLDRDPFETLPYIAAGMIMWSLLVNCITDGSTTFIDQESYIRNIPLPISIHIFQMLMRNVIMWSFNMIVFICLLMIIRPPLSGNTFLFLLGLPLFLLNIGWIAFMAGILSTRFRDIPQVILSVIQVLFFLTPVFWSISDLPSRPAFVTYNPLYHLLEVVRAPLLGLRPPLTSWAVCLVMAFFGTIATIYLYRRAYARIAYWV